MIASSPVQAQLSASDYYLQAVTYAKQEKYIRAITALNEAIRLNQNYTEAYYLRGLAYTTQDRATEAITDFTQVIRLDSNFAKAYYIRGLNYLQLDNSDQGLEDLQMAANLFQQENQIQEYEKAVALINEVLASNPMPSNSSEKLANGMYGAGVGDAAIEIQDGQYRFADVAGLGPWQPVSELVPVGFDIVWMPSPNSSGGIYFCGQPYPDPPYPPHYCSEYGYVMDDKLTIIPPTGARFVQPALKTEDLTDTEWVCGNCAGTILTTFQDNGEVTQIAAHLQQKGSFRWELLGGKVLRYYQPGEWEQIYLVDQVDGELHFHSPDQPNGNNPMIYRSR
ncbi:MAG: tetratricopeptide repeat protein [Halothece sp. Uz-M2-17]|nr:tetratricopeptide repeat protein [Halothece sp. Uz-M2-17]